MGLKNEIGDSAVIPIPNSDLLLVKNIDIFTPILDEPDLMGEIAAVNVTNDIFALNVSKISGMLVFLGIKSNMPIYIAEGILKGIKRLMEKKLNSKIVGGHTIFSEWPLIGGEASGFVKKDKIIRKNKVMESDKLILTKPIGNQAIMAAYRLRKTHPDLLENYSNTKIDYAIKLAIDLMTTPLQKVVATIHQYSDVSFIHSMTDVSGFGLAGHLEEMLQNSTLSAEIIRIPYIYLGRNLAYDFGYNYDECRMAETAGGMLLAIDYHYAEEFSDQLVRNGIQNWIIGSIENSNKPQSVHIFKEVEHLEIKKI